MNDKYINNHKNNKKATQLDSVHKQQQQHSKFYTKQTAHCKYDLNTASGFELKFDALKLNHTSLFI